MFQKKKEEFFKGFLLGSDSWLGITFHVGQQLLGMGPAEWLKNPMALPWKKLTFPLPAAVSYRQHVG